MQDGNAISKYLMARSNKGLRKKDENGQVMPGKDAMQSRWWPRSQALQCTREKRESVVHKIFE